MIGNWIVQDKGIETFQRSLPNGKVRQVFFFDPDGEFFSVKYFWQVLIYIYITTEPLQKWCR